MARLARLAIADHLHHVAQVGLNGGHIVIDDEDRAAWTSSFTKLAIQYTVSVHAWVLLPDRFHLLVTPRDGGGLSKFMQALAREHVRQFNRRHRRTGTLWASRFSSSVLEPEVYGLACMLMLDHLPVEAGLVEKEIDYKWSSHGYYAGSVVSQGAPRLEPQPFVWQLGNTPFAREHAYRLLAESRPMHRLDSELKRALVGGWPLGSREFLYALSSLAQRRVFKSLPGRPRKG